MLEGTWRAVLSDGRTFTETSGELVGERSPWRELERLCRESGVQIVGAEVELGLRKLALDAEGAPLVCGQAVEVEKDLLGGRETAFRYRWVCRQAADEWVWRITDGLMAWEIATEPGTPGLERMPSPPRGERA